MVIRATSMALAAQEALENQVILKPTTETITLIDDIISDDMVIATLFSLPSNAISNNSS